MEYYYGVSESASLEHFGVKMRSGRYKWGSGDRPYQRLEGTKGYFARRKLEKIADKTDKAAERISRETEARNNAIFEAKKETDDYLRLNKLQNIKDISKEELRDEFLKVGKSDPKAAIDYLNKRDMNGVYANAVSNDDINKIRVASGDPFTVTEDGFSNLSSSELDRLTERDSIKERKVALDKTGIANIRTRASIVKTYPEYFTKEEAKAVRKEHAIDIGKKIAKIAGITAASIISPLGANWIYQNYWDEPGEVTTTSNLSLMRVYGHDGYDAYNKALLEFSKK